MGNVATKTANAVKRYRMYQIPSDVVHKVYSDESRAKHPALFNMVRDKSFIGYGDSRGLLAVQNLHELGFYRAICTVSARNLEEAWVRTQSVEDAYWESPHVLMSEDFLKGAPSGSVGDIYEDVETKALYVVARFGFVDIKTGERV